MEDFELIKEKLSGYTLTSILKSSHELIVAVENAKDKTYPFWHVLVLIKWAHLCSKDSIFRKKATIGDIQEIVILINTFHDRINPIDFRKGIKRGLKIIAYQQFWFQDKMDEYVLFRSYVLFNSIQTNVDINKELNEKTGFNRL